MADLGNIGNFNQPNFNIGGTTQTTGTTGVGDSTQAPPDNSASTISKSQEVALKALLDAAIPMLAAPWFTPTSFTDFYNSSQSNSISGISNITGMSSADVLMSSALAMEEITNEVLDSWVASIQKEAERVEEERNSPQFQAWLAAQSPQARQKMEQQDQNDSTASVKGSAEYQSWLNSLSPTEKADELSRETQYQAVIGYQNSIVNLSSGIDNFVQDKFVNGNSVNPVSDYLQLAVVTQGLVISGAFLSTVTPVVETTQNQPLGVNPIVDAVNQILPPQGPDQSTIAMFAINFFAVPLMDLSTTENFAKTAGTGSKPVDINTAKNFAAEVINMVTNPELFNVALAIYVAKAETTQPMTEQQVATFGTQIKIVLLSLALALMYKTELKDAGKITDIEMAGLLTGGIPIAKGDIKANLVSLIMANINDLPPSIRVGFLDNVLAYMDSDPSVEALMDPERAVDSIFAQAPEEPPKKA